MPRSYFEIPYEKNAFAHALCRGLGAPDIVWDPSQKKFFWPGSKPPQLLLNHFRRLAVVPDNYPEPKYVDTGFKLTDEQVRFRDSEPGGPERLLIGKAFAGATKTTTIKEYAKARPHSRFLYLAFNHVTKVEAETSFPPNTKCKTTHSMAHEWLSPELKKKVCDDLKPDAVCEALGFSPIASNLATATLVKSLLHGYCVSADSVPATEHLGHLADLMSGARWAMVDELPTLVRYTSRLWSMMIDPTHPLGLTHDAYLKLYALHEPKWDFDYLLLDESQDTNPVTEQLFFSQAARKIIVGDPHQSIYSFRKSRDILSPRASSDTPTVFLTHSFRFGQEIADLANHMLGHFKGETHRLIGRGKPAKLWRPFSTDWSLRPTGAFVSHTIISRTNASLFDAAVRAIDCIEAYEQVTNRPGPKIGFIGTSARANYSPFHTYKFGRLLDLVSLEKGEVSKIVDPFIRRFSNIRELWDLVNDEATRDADLASAIRLYNRYKGALPWLVRKIGERAADPNSPKVWIRFCTAHKSKGLEWTRVKLANDFPRLTDDTGLLPPRRIPEEEVNLLYVAVTRAKEDLEVCPRLMNFLHFSGQASMVHNQFGPVSSAVTDPSEMRRDEWITYFRRLIEKANGSKQVAAAT